MHNSTSEHFYLQENTSYLPNPSFLLIHLLNIILHLTGFLEDSLTLQKLEHDV